MTIYRSRFKKTAEIHMRGISAETLRSYPRPEPMPSAGYEKAQQILQKMPSSEEKTAGIRDGARAYWHTMKGVPGQVWEQAKAHPVLTGAAVAANLGIGYGLKRLRKRHAEAQKASQEGSEKAAGIRPDRMEPGYDALLGSKKRKKRGADAERIKSFGAHTLGGAGAAKFLHDWADQGRMAYWKPKMPLDPLSPRGPSPASPKTKFLVISGGAGLGALEYARKRLKKHKEEKAMLKTKTSGVGNLGAEEYAQFKAKVLTRAAAQAEAEALFNQANVSRAQAQRAVKGMFVQADGAETMAPTLTKKASISKVAVGDGFVNAVKDIPHRVSKEGVTVAARDVYKGAKASLSGYGRGPVATALKRGNLGEAGSMLARGAKRLFTKQSHVDEFFEKLSESRLTAAQRRYPELQKVSMAPGGLGTRPAPALGKRPARTTPAASMMSGGTP